MGLLLQCVAVILVTAVHANDVPLSVTTGGLFTVDFDDRQEGRRLHRRDLESMMSDERHYVRLQTDDGLPPLDMEVTQGSVWSQDSVVEVFDGHQTYRVPQSLDTGCFLHGHVKSFHGGAVSINRCGRMTGKIHVPGYLYELEEISPSLEGNHLDMAHAKFKVTKTEAEIEPVNDEYNDFLNVDVDSITKPVQEDHSTTRKKRQANQTAVVEAALFIDPSYVDFMNSTFNITTNDQIRDWVVDRWNTVQGVYSNTEVTGVHMRIKVKRLLIWRTNPRGYPDICVHGEERLEWFCRNTAGADPYDLKVLYYMGRRSKEVGNAYRNGICIQNNNCLTVRPKTASVRIELHKIGHTLGFPNQPSFDEDCGSVEGFMGGIDTYLFLPCYRNLLTSVIGNHTCLYEETATNHLALDLQ